MEEKAGGRRKGALKKRRQVKSSSSADFKLSSYADASDARSRIRKSDSAVISPVTSPEAEEDVDWFDRDEDELAADIEKLSVRESNKKSREDDVYEPQAQAFPYDFWFLLSSYIPPEDVGRFAQISQLTNHIVKSQAFWRRMYARYYRYDLELDSSYAPAQMSRPLGLRTKVIKMLHLIYPPYLPTSQISSIWPDLDLLVGRVCSLFWTNKLSSKICLFYLKLKDVHLATQTSKHREYFPDTADDQDEEGRRSTQRLLNNLSDIHANSENGCKLLQITAVSWCSVPALLGLRLRSIGVSVSHGMRHHKVQLEFGGSRRGPSEVRVIIDSVANIKVLNWWNRHYITNPSTRTNRSVPTSLDPFNENHHQQH